MQIPKGATVAVADGQKLSLFQNSGDEAAPNLTALPVGDIATTNKSGGASHFSSAANPDDAQIEEDAFSAGIAELLNKEVLAGRIKALIVVAAPKTLGELRKHYHPKLRDVLSGEISKELTGHTSDDIERAIAAA